LAEPKGALDGIVAVEIGGFVGAHYAARSLADLGAAFIKVDRSDALARPGAA
jgi:crotonobetainyl-CoA:carnitine CoA-transferase CaiB-like acyl-CoA transferase